MRSKEAIIQRIIAEYRKLYYGYSSSSLIIQSIPTNRKSLKTRLEQHIRICNPHTGHLICMVPSKDRKETLTYIDSLNFHDIECTGVETAVSRLFPFLIYDEHRTFGKTFPELFRYHIIIARWNKATWATIAVNKFVYGEG